MLIYGSYVLHNELQCFAFNKIFYIYYTLRFCNSSIWAIVRLSIRITIGTSLGERDSKDEPISRAASMLLQKIFYFNLKIYIDSVLLKLSKKIFHFMQFVHTFNASKELCSLFLIFLYTFFRHFISNIILFSY